MKILPNFPTLFGKNNNIQTACAVQEQIIFIIDWNQKIIFFCNYTSFNKTLNDLTGKSNYHASEMGIQLLNAICKINQYIFKIVYLFLRSAFTQYTSIHNA